MTQEVLVAGAGPAGLTLAAELARFGVNVRVVEKAASRAEMSKALVVWSRTLELLDRVGCGDEFVRRGMKVSAANVIANGHTIGRIDLGSVATPHPYALMIPQSLTEQLLEDHLNGFGVQVERGLELLDFVDRGDRVIARMRRGDGSEEKTECRWLVGCDGAHSTVRHGLRMVFTGDAQPSSWVAADVKIQGLRAPHEIKLGWHQDGVLVIYPLSPGRYRVIADVGPSEGPAKTEPELAGIQSIIVRRASEDVQVSDPTWMATFHINERKAADYRVGRVFLAGDAAHVHSPAGGQGMNTGMQDAFNLAWKLALVSQHRCAEEPLLGSYSSERSAVGEELIRNAGRMTSLAILQGEVKQSIRNHIASLLFGINPLHNAVADVLTEVSVDYQGSPLNAPDPYFHEHPVPGERAPIRAGEPPFGSGKTPRFAICSDAPSSESAKDAAAVLTQTYQDLLEPALRPPFVPGGLWLVRPDGYVALATLPDGWQKIGAYLQSLTGR